MSNSANVGADQDHVGHQLRTLEQCALHKRTLRLTCLACRRARVMDAAALWWLFRKKGWEDSLTAAVGRLCCEVCRAEGGRIVRPLCEVTRDMPEGSQPPYPNKYEWKRLVSRYRS